MNIVNPMFTHYLEVHSYFTAHLLITFSFQALFYIFYIIWTLEVHSYFTAHLLITFSFQALFYIFYIIWRYILNLLFIY